RQEGAAVEADLRPQRLVVGLEYDPFQTAIEALLDVQGHAPHGDVLPLRARLVVAGEGAGAPDDRVVNGEGAEAVDGLDVQLAVLDVGHRNHRTDGAHH